MCERAGALGAALAVLLPLFTKCPEIGFSELRLTEFSDEVPRR